MGKNVELSQSLVEQATAISVRENRTVPEQIEFYFNIAAIAEQNPDLSFRLIKEIIKADAEKATKEY